MSKIVSLPPRLTSDLLAKYAKAGEASIVLKAPSIGDSAPYELHDDAGKFYIFKWSGAHQGHILRIPAGIWMQNNAKMAHDLLDKHKLPTPLVVLLELPKVQEVNEAPASSLSQECSSRNEVIEEAIPVPEAEPEAKLEAEPEIEVQSKDAPSSNAEVIQDGSHLMWKEFPLHLAISESLKDKPLRLAELRTMFDVDDATLKLAINCPVSKSELGHAGWVKLK